MKTIVLLSGGLDSAVVLAACINDGQCLGLGFMYGQKHGQIEQSRATSVARYYGVRFEQVVLPTMPKIDNLVFAGRNLVFASVAISMAQAGGYERVAFGCNASDWLNFPDCRPEFWGNIKRCGDTYGVAVLTPLIYFTKRDVVEMARKLKVPIDMTWSCYDPKGVEPCGECLACKTRNEALA